MPTIALSSELRMPLWSSMVAVQVPGLQTQFFKLSEVISELPPPLGSPAQAQVWHSRTS